MNRKRLSFLLKWAILLATLIFLGKTMYENWREFKRLELEQEAQLYLTLALTTALMAQVWMGTLWVWILQALDQPVAWTWGVRKFLTIDVAKFLPGNVWHLYGRVRATQEIGIPVQVGTSSILLEPILVTAAAMIFALLNTAEPVLMAFCSLALVCILIGVHPRCFAWITRGISHLSQLPGVRQLTRRLHRQSPDSSPPVVLHLKKYPWAILLGELVLVGLRSISFMWIAATFTDIQPEEIPLLIGGFSFAWILGLIMPGAPDGVGVFEATAIARLDDVLPAAQVIAAVLVYRLVSVLAIVLGAGIGWAMTLTPRLRRS